jgi:hypothetical protein
MTATRSGLFVLTSSWLLSPALAEPFIGQFELKTLESAPGSFEFQSQNAWMSGHPPRRAEMTPEGMVLDENAVIAERYALELEMGLTHIFKMRVGIEFEQERLDEPPTLAEANDFDELTLTELGVELIAVLTPREVNGTGLGVVAEIERPTDEAESSNLILGPIIEFQSGPWFASAVPMLVYAFGADAEDGTSSDNKWDFAYAAQLRYALSRSWILALEGYGTVERLGSSGHPSQAAQLFGDFDQHRLGPVVYYAREIGSDREDANVSMGIGLLGGLNENTADHSVKFSVEIDF